MGKLTFRFEDLVDLRRSKAGNELLGESVLARSAIIIQAAGNCSPMECVTRGVGGLATILRRLHARHPTSFLEARSS